jgi:hypothetical protein
MSYLKASDTISGQEGRAYATIDGENVEMFYLKNLEATIEKQKAELKALGRRGVQHRAAGWKGTGTMTIYYVTSRFRQMMYDYISTGKDVYFDITVINEDPNSTVGKQQVQLKNVNLDKVIVAKLDTESDILDEEVGFTFEDVLISSSFADPVLGG